MKLIKGVWQFNPTLLAPIDELVRFTVRSLITYNGTEQQLVMQCSRVVFSGNNSTYEGRYYVEESEILSSTHTLPTFIEVYHQDGWNTDLYGFGISTIDFGTESQAVSEEFYEWLTTNAQLAAASVQYNNETIVNLYSGQSATLKCKGLTMETDIIITTSSGGSVQPYDGEIVVIFD